MLKKLKIKFVCINMTIITLMLVFILCMVVQFTKQGMEQDNIRMMEQMASNPLYLIKPTDNIDIRLPYFSVRLDHNGAFMESLSSYYDTSDHEFLNEVVHVSNGIQERVGVIPEYDLRFMRIMTPTDRFMIFVDISNELTTIDHLTQTCIAIGIFSFFVFLGISVFFANWAVKPVDRAWTQQKQFIADASHELKTPLTVILTNTEMLQTSDYNTETRTHFTDNIQTMAKHMRSLVEGLLELSRIDNGSIKAVMSNLDFSSIVENAICIFEPLYFENGLILEDEIVSDIALKGSEEHLKQVLEILLDNALKYADSQTLVQVTLKKLEKKHILSKNCQYCLLTVTSRGDTISSEDLKNIFKRFYRADKSRNRDGSYGLGLSIAESIVTEHRGKIWAESHDGINTFYVKLPIRSLNR